MTPSYDLELLLPVHLTGHRRQRLDTFRQYGLLNLGTYRVRLVILSGTWDFSSHQDGWPCQLLVLPGPDDDPAMKVYNFYATRDEAWAAAARWFARVDDDSITDVGGLIQYLDA